MAYLSPRGHCARCEYENHIKMRDQVVQLHMDWHHGNREQIRKAVTAVTSAAVKEIGEDFKAMKKRKLD
jgi:hypothetical protein